MFLIIVVIYTKWEILIHFMYILYSEWINYCVGKGKLTTTSKNKHHHSRLPGMNYNFSWIRLETGGHPQITMCCALVFKLPCYVMLAFSWWLLPLQQGNRCQWLLRWWGWQLLLITTVKYNEINEIDNSFQMHLEFLKCRKPAILSAIKIVTDDSLKARA